MNWGFGTARMGVGTAGIGDLEQQVRRIWDNRHGGFGTAGMGDFGQ